MEDGVWRTISGRRVFIKEGQTLTEAMKNSGKFKSQKKESSKKEKAMKAVLLRQERDKLYEKVYRKSSGATEEEKSELKKQIAELSQQIKELEKDLMPDDLKNARHEIKEGKHKKKEVDFKKERNVGKKLYEKNKKEIEEEVAKSLVNIERYEGDYGIDDAIIEEIEMPSVERIEKMYDKGEISEFAYEEAMSIIRERKYEIMEKKGYEIYQHNGKTYYSTLPKAKKSYDDMLVELTKKGYSYEISRSWNAGEMPSIYVKLEDGEVFRISNHYNNQNQMFEANSLEMNKVYSNKDYINYKETILKDLENKKNNL